jgi:Outer membrane protein beta-barrel domain
MKKLFLILLCFTAVQVATTNAQTFKWGIRGGLSTPDIKPGDVDSILFERKTTSTRIDSFKLKVSDANYGYHFGVWGRLKIAGFYVQPEVLFNSSKVQYKIGKLRTPTTLDSIKSETFQNLDIPVLVGTKLGSFRLSAGPVAHVRIGGTSDLTNAGDFSEKFKTATWGYQLGLGFDAGRVGIDLRYEGNGSNFGNHISIGGKPYEFSKAPARFIASVAIAL